MDNQIVPNRFLTTKNIFIALGVVVLLEFIWAGWTLTKSSTPPPPKKVSTQTVSKNPTSISLKADKTNLRVGEKSDVSVNISSEKLTDGTDLIISYDPKLLSPETLAKTGQPMVVGAMYNDYPANSLDNKKGTITVSGVSTKQGGIVPNGLFGSITFVTKAAGLAKVSLQFSPGSTVDSNVIESGTGKDVLEKVNNLEINIVP